MDPKMHQNGDVVLLFDWCAFTVTRLDVLGPETNGFYIFERICKVFRLRGLSYEKRPGRYGWNICMYSNGISVSFGGREDVGIELSGSGCRAWETINPGLSWEWFFGYLRSSFGSLHFSRLDVACDTFGLLSTAKIKKCRDQGKWVSRWRHPEIQDSDIKFVAYWGSSKSDFLCRIYDKTLERIAARAEDVPDKWVRIEFQFRNKAVKSFFNAWEKTGDLSAAFFGLLRNQLVFTVNIPDKKNCNYSRVKIAPWWDKLLGNAGRIKMAYCGGMEYNLESLKRYVLGQAGSSVHTYLQVVGAERLMADIRSRPLNDRQRALLATAQQMELPGEGERSAEQFR